jgi:hypothetical protein
MFYFKNHRAFTYTQCRLLWSGRIPARHDIFTIGIYHMDHTRRPKPLTYQVSFDPEKAQEEREEGNEGMSGA